MIDDCATCGHRLGGHIGASCNGVVENNGVLQSCGCTGFVRLVPAAVRKRVPNLRKLLASPDEMIAKAAKELAVQARLLEILTPLSPEQRRRVMHAAAILYGVEL